MEYVEYAPSAGVNRNLVRPVGPSPPTTRSGRRVMTHVKRIIGTVLIAFIPAVLINAAVLSDSTPGDAMSYEQTTSNGDAAKKLNTWSAGPRLAGHEMIAKYGAPQEVTDDRMIWHNAGPIKRILLTREEPPHHFPIVHMDYLQHTINYDVPADKADDTCVGCERDGPVESAGEEIDNAIDDVGDEIEDVGDETTDES